MSYSTPRSISSTYLCYLRPTDWQIGKFVDWSLVTDHWSLVTDHWRLVIGHLNTPVSGSHRQDWPVAFFAGVGEIVV